MYAEQPHNIDAARVYRDEARVGATCRRLLSTGAVSLLGIGTAARACRVGDQSGLTNAPSACKPSPVTDSGSGAPHAISPPIEVGASGAQHHATAPQYYIDEAGPTAIALTLDDGPHPLYTPRVLDILDRYGAGVVADTARQLHPGVAVQIIGPHMRHEHQSTAVISWACTSRTMPCSLRQGGHRARGAGYEFNPPVVPRRRASYRFDELNSMHDSCSARYELVLVVRPLLRSDLVENAFVYQRAGRNRGVPADLLARVLIQPDQFAA